MSEELSKKVYVNPTFLKNGTSFDELFQCDCCGKEVRQTYEVFACGLETNACAACCGCAENEEDAD